MRAVELVLQLGDGVLALLGERLCIGELRGEVGCVVRKGRELRFLGGNSLCGGPGQEGVCVLEVGVRFAQGGEGGAECSEFVVALSL